MDRGSIEAIPLRIGVFENVVTDQDRATRGTAVWILAATFFVACGADTASLGDTDAKPGTGLEDDAQPDGLYGTVAFQCSPRRESADNGACGPGYSCCSTDPSTLGGQRPDFDARDIAIGMPYFAGPNNDLGTKGMCVHLESVREELSLTVDEALGCPIPCNPTWGADDIEATCGEGVECCQTAVIEPDDCIQDDLDDPLSWRPVRSSDIFEGRTDWASARHRTHQDPNGSACQSFVTRAGVLDDPGFAACIEALTVADQRGYCGRIARGCGQDEALDACQQINMGLIPPPV